MKTYHIYSKAAPGPAGIRCPCCNMVHSGRSQKSTKTFINRAVRRKAKADFRASAVRTSILTAPETVSRSRI